jgi:hypothetical protein
VTRLFANQQGSDSMLHILGYDQNIASETKEEIPNGQVIDIEAEEELAHS